MANITINKSGSSIFINKPSQPSSIRLETNIRDLVMVAGQSNAASYHNATTDNAVLVPYGFIGDQPMIKCWEVSSFQNMNIPNPATTFPNTTSTITNWGMEQHTLHGLKDKYGRPTYFTRSFSGGTAIGFWLLNNTVRGLFRSNLVDAINAIVALGFTPRVTLLWVQGEQDALDPARYSIYDDNLRQLIDETSALTPTIHTSAVRWILCKLTSTSYAGTTGGDAVNAAMDEVAAERSNVYVFDPATVCTPFAGNHYFAANLVPEFSLGIWNWFQAQGLL